MELQLIDDLPLFAANARQAHARLAVEQTMAAAATDLPAALRYIPYRELVEWWLGNARIRADRFVLVGARPALLNAAGAVASHSGAIVQVKVRRELDPAGHTVAARVPAAFDTALAELSGTAAEVCVIDDVLMSGHTLSAVVDRIRAAAPAASISIRLFLENAFAGREFRARHPDMPIQSARRVDYRPVAEGTAIFLRDLLYGTLRGKEFLDQSDLLRPFFGSDLGPFHALRATIDGVARPSPIGSR
ncbi:hypothetical protein IU500_23170 [Nocardia terpenica]|nr:hypothetical protein [Nocardia terpenica]MBF6064432.1 hypothetical protein [Nocardia terpenica]MBF6106944.1 hypothetical protein [Nocardia terpenica]MBF6114400.1 hypothetical protein [Nocardia terpenica]MBF6121514.1 hypothetical protein [Nocardia terpenica]MBF6153929.1 hypothetical protein [Nocardia terpenica]